MKSRLTLLWAVCLMLAVPMVNASSIPATINVIEGPEGTLPTVSVSGFDIQTPDIAIAGPEDAAIGSLLAGEFHTTSPDTGLTIAYGFMLEPGSREISDFVTLIFIVSGGEASVVELFASDKGNDLGVLGVGFPAIVENGTLQDLSSSFANVAGVPVDLPAGLEIGAQSDISEVPEPATWLLFASGLPGLVACRRWFRTQAVQAPLRQPTSGGRMPRWIYWLKLLIWPTCGAIACRRRGHLDRWLQSGYSSRLSRLQKPWM